MKSESDAQPGHERADGGGKRIPAAAHQEVADDDAVSEQGEGAPYHGSALRGRVARVIVPQRNGERRQCDRWRRPEKSREAFWTQHVCEQRKGGNRKAADQEASDIFHHVSPT